jgi:hypothetical protein
MVQLDTNDIPQADLIWDVARVPETILRGATTTAAVAVSLGDKGPRQGLYYTQAGRILGLVADGENGAPLDVTPDGRTFATYNSQRQRGALRLLVLRREPTRYVIAALKQRGGLTRSMLAQVLQELAPLSWSTALRRAQTMSLWLCALDLVKRQSGLLVYCGPGTSTVGSGRAEELLVV